MGFGSTAKKVQQVVSLVKDTSERVQELREELLETREQVDLTAERVRGIEDEQAEQRALLEALAREQGVDVAAVLSDLEEEATHGETDPGDATAE